MALTNSKIDLAERKKTHIQLSIALIEKRNLQSLYHKRKNETTLTY